MFLQKRRWLWAEIQNGLWNLPQDCILSVNPHVIFKQDLARQSEGTVLKEPVMFGCKKKNKQGPANNWLSAISVSNNAGLDSTGTKSTTQHSQKSVVDWKPSLDIDYLAQQCGVSKALECWHSIQMRGGFGYAENRSVLRWRSGSCLTFCQLRRYDFPSPMLRGARKDRQVSSGVQIK